MADLWVQQMWRNRRILYDKVEGAKNFSDALTKPLDGPELWRQMKLAGLVALTGRSQLAPASKRAASWAAAGAEELQEYGLEAQRLQGDGPDGGGGGE